MTEYLKQHEEKLKKMIVPQTKKEDFEAFWSEQVAFLHTVPLEVQREVMDTPYEKSFRSWKLTYNTHDKTVIEAIFSCPADRKEGEKLPCVVIFHGGDGGGAKRLYPDFLATGVCCLAMDVRGQCGTTLDQAEYRSGDYMTGLMTRGIFEKEECYLRNIYLDAVRAMDVAASLDEVDPARMVTYGGSQGGALSVVASALSGKSKKCYTAITSYNCLARRVEAGSGVFNRVRDMIWKYPETADRILENLTYFDINNMISLLEIPLDICLGLSDPICLPHFVYSVYHHAPGSKKLRMYPFTPHKVRQDYLESIHQELAAL